MAQSLLHNHWIVTTSKHWRSPTTAIDEARTIAHPPDKKRRTEKRTRKRRQSLDGDGSWRIKTGERRVNDRRHDEQDDDLIIHLPFLDDALASDNSQSDSTTGNPHDSNNAVSSSHEASTTSGKPSTNAATESHRSNDTVMKKTAKHPKDLTSEQQARLSALKNMLEASNNRYKEASRKRRPMFAAGIEVKVVNGEHMGAKGVVLDADYIESRALVSIQDQEAPVWIAFRHLGNPG